MDAPCRTDRCPRPSSGAARPAAAHASLSPRLPTQRTHELLEERRRDVLGARRRRRCVRVDVLLDRKVRLHAVGERQLLVDARDLLLTKAPGLGQVDAALGIQYAVVRDVHQLEHRRQGLQAVAALGRALVHKLHTPQVAPVVGRVGRILRQRAHLDKVGRDVRLGVLEDAQELARRAVLQPDDLLVGNEARARDKVVRLVVARAARRQHAPPVVVVHVRVQRDLLPRRARVRLYVRVQERLAGGLVAHGNVGRLRDVGKHLRHVTQVRVELVAEARAHHRRAGPRVDEDRQVHVEQRRVDRKRQHDQAQRARGKVLRKAARRDARVG
eukprot:Unigene6361_Nuclearia_a/m.19603 Unigene6361_Nuclearia_a/g.19603  ORF Unigene6361_Nuclearia_a/g.19603 Unigene6361_Nuclearia_a/m.19603 type:complete len:328 (+) Unigene6361_Nuclearia_a:1214-2197(+)